MRVAICARSIEDIGLPLLGMCRQPDMLARAWAGGYTKTTMTVPLELLVILVLIGANALMATGELALISARRPRLAVLEARGESGAAAARRLAEEPAIFLPTLQAGLTLIGILIGVFGGERLATHFVPVLLWMHLPAPLAGDLALVAAVVLEAFATLVLGELVPKQLALRHPESVAVALAGPILLLSRIAAPVVWLLDAATGAVLRLLGVTGVLRESVTEEELKAVLAEGAEVGVLEEGERDMIERLLRMADKPVRAIMTSRTELAWIDRTAPREEIVATLTETAHSRFVVCDGAVDNVVGVVLAKDMLNRVLAGGTLVMADVLRQPAVMPDTVTALDALERLRADELGLALVLDEYGSFEGIVTAADVLAAIIGEARDEPPRLPDAAPQTEFQFDGLTPADELQSRLHMALLPEGSFHTVGGLVLALLRRVPEQGDAVVWQGWRFAVEAMDGRRVASVRVSLEATEPAVEHPSI